MKIRFVLAFSWFYGVSTLVRSPIYVLSYLALPLSLLFFIYFVSHGTLTDFGILGGLISVVVSNSLSLIGDFAFFRLYLRLQDLLVATEIGPMDYVAGLALGNLVYSIPGIILYVIIGTHFGVFNLAQLPVIALVLLVLLSSSTGLSITLASFLKHTRHSWGLSTFMSLLFTLLPPLYYPYVILPKPILYALYASPSTAGSIVLQGYLGLAPLDPLAVWVLTVEGVAFSAIPFFALRWREK
ncbi:MAG: ABC transporter permease [Candidatus Aramenus sp.]|nr:ABC transporter permease [Candidatus Aramenus sp.]